MNDHLNPASLTKKIMQHGRLNTDYIVKGPKLGINSEYDFHSIGVEYKLL